MASPFFTLAMQAPGRQRAFRRTVAFHLLILTFLAWTATQVAPKFLPFFGDAVLVLGIIEGAAMVGWRLVQIPKSQALEFLLVSPLQPRRVLIEEAAAGLGRFALISLCGGPILLLVVFHGSLQLSDVPVLILTPFLWGSLGGLALTVWAYEHRTVRRWGERFAIVAVLFYLVVGVLAAERLQVWISRLPRATGDAILRVVEFAFMNNPFTALEYWLSPNRTARVAVDRLLWINVAGLIVGILLLARAAMRLQGHFQDRHYTPAVDRHRGGRNGIGDRPLTWWAVRRVMEYSGRMNIWLAGGFGAIYAAYVVLGDAWPPWLGKMVFQIFDHLGGVPAMTAGLVVLAAVPASFQYGLWDASTHDRCKRLELLLLTELDGTDYWSAAAAAAWRRGRGYFLVAAMLWGALAISGKASLLQVLAAASVGALLWAFSFAVGFRAFSRGVHANGLGTLLTLGLPLLAAVLVRVNIPILSALLPVGALYQALTQTPNLYWLPGPILLGAATLIIAHTARQRCAGELRLWFDRNQGIKTLD